MSVDKSMLDIETKLSETIPGLIIINNFRGLIFSEVNSRIKLYQNRISISRVSLLQIMTVHLFSKNQKQPKRPFPLHFQNNNKNLVLSLIFLAQVFLNVIFFLLKTYSSIFYMRQRAFLNRFLLKIGIYKILFNTKF